MDGARKPPRMGSRRVFRSHPDKRSRGPLIFSMQRDGMT
jgi:hypothetical protein